METTSTNLQAEGAEARKDGGTDAGRSPMDSNSFDTQSGSTFRTAPDATQDYLQDAKSKASAAVETGKAYAQAAVNAAGKKIDDVKGQAADLKQRGVEYAAQEPMKAVAIAAAGSAVVTALLMTLMRARR
ncbi:hypothetical protein QTH90_29755 [Variovorax sp. J2P1-59]|uniref:hypothetical protein n=1 Tax=Variovorax flavidus TaxID=3053501 RepID=UPI0025778521|nr:hypothetical protein [Variovorax sp. J2P1-59]MDM0078625.1 hypothetical protein [Variovorax sp. J2P1-59]